MKFLFKSKDGGPESNVTGYWLIEWKKVFSIVLLRFSLGSRENYHNHAFHALSWVLKGYLVELPLHGGATHLKPSIIPTFTSRSRMHKVIGIDDYTWVLSFRGPWNKSWREYNKTTGTFTTLTNGRKIIDEQNCSNRQST